MRTAERPVFDWLFDNPLIARQARLNSRSRMTVVTVVLYPCLLGAFGVSMIATRGGGAVTGEPGVGLRQAVFLTVALQLFLVILLVPTLAAGAIAGERQGMTFDMLILSRMSSVQIIYGKLVGSLLYIVPLIAASLPLVLAIFLYARLSLVGLLWAELLTVVTTIAAASLSILVSTVVPRVVPATVVAQGLMLAAYAVTGLPALAQGAGSTRDFGGVVPNVAFNPFSALYVVLVDAPSQGDLSGWQRPWASALVQALLAITSLAAAAAVLRRPVRSTRVSPPG
ncbi:MAG: ABC transporter permease [Acidimicrobiales bacterium]